MKKKYFISILSLPAVLAGASLFYYMQGFYLPAPNNIASMRILTMDNRFIEIPESRYAHVLSLFDGAIKRNDYIHWQVMGNLEISKKFGRPINIALFYTRQPTGAFAINGVYYRGSTDAQFENFINKNLEQYRQKAAK